MINKIIIAPHLQSRRQKISAFCIAAISWLLWLYFLLPLLTLAAWLLGFKHLSTEIRWFGGYKTLLELLQMYGLIIASIALGWFLWTLFTTWWKPAILPTHQVQADDAGLCAAFQITERQLQQSRLTQVVTVSFNEAGQITAMTGNQSPR